MIANEPIGCNEVEGPTDSETGPIIVAPWGNFTGGPETTCALYSNGPVVQSHEVYYDGYNLFRAGQFAAARQEFEKIASVSATEHLNASDICKHYINVAKVMAQGEAPLYNLSNPGNGGLLLAENGISIFPNPAQSAFSILYEGEDFELRVYDIMGKAVHSGLYSKTATIPTADWRNGIYIIDLLDVVTREVKMGKVVISK
ncbi:MAG: hypothetical protein ACI8P3_000827 [Saprospiraceae bacterium]|jgi:hypothetical protein